MSQYNDFNLCVNASEELNIYQLVELDASREVAKFDGTGVCLGTARAFAEANKPVTVNLLNKQGTLKMIADGAISAGAVVYGGSGADAGKVSAAGTVKIGMAVETAAADGDVIEVAPSFVV